MEETTLKLEDLNTVDLGADCPPPEMTDEQWQDYFGRMKLLVYPTKERSMSYRSNSVTVNGQRLEGQSLYNGETQWYRYCQFINSILSAIRHKEHDYCYNIYQITDLLKFEHDRLRTRWLPEDRCIEVWLSD